MDIRNWWLLALIAAASCSAPQKPVELPEEDPPLQVTEEQDTAPTVPDMGLFEKSLRQKGLVNVADLDSTIAVDLRYSTDNNFLGQDVYGDFDQCYLQQDVAEKLLIAQSLLRSKYPNYRLIVFDAVRPRSLQWRMWNLLKMPVAEKIKFISNPKYGSLHNFGAAVDVSIVDQYGEELDMGTEFDHLGVLAYPTAEQRLLKEGKLQPEQVNNRKLLREVMYAGGFFNIQTEWWHFNSCYRNEARKKYQIIE